MGRRGSSDHEMATSPRGTLLSDYREGCRDEAEWERVSAAITGCDAADVSGDQQHGVLMESTHIRVDLYDGGGIEVTMANYRPVSLHCRVLSSDIAGSVVAEAVGHLVQQWVHDQKIGGRVREV